VALIKQMVYGANCVTVVFMIRTIHRVEGTAMSVYRRGEVYWVDVKVKGHPRIRKSAATSDRLKALDFEAALRRTLAGVVSHEPIRGEMTLSEAMARAFKVHWNHKKSAKTVGFHARSLLEKLGNDIRLKDIGENEVRGLVRQLQSDGNSAATINSKLSVLQTLLRMSCNEWRVIDRVPRFDRLKEKEGRLRTLSPEEESRLLALLRRTGRHDAADLYMVLLDTGASLSEVLSLKWKGVDLVGGKIGIDVESGRNRILPMTRRVRSMLMQRMGMGIKSPFSNVTYQQAEYNWKWVRKQMGLGGDPGFVIHSLRHTFAARTVQKGIGLPALKALLGHSTIRLTERYARFGAGNIHRAVDACSGGGVAGMEKRLPFDGRPG